jgi:hypothetical protein
MDQKEGEALARRLRQVERRMGVIVAGWLLSILLLAVLWVGMQQVSSQTIMPQVIKARTFNVVDQNDHTRVTIGLSDQGNAGIWLYDVAGKSRVHMGVDFARAPSIWFADENGNERIRLGLADAQARSMSQDQANAPTRLWLAVDPTGAPRLGVYTGGKERLGFGLNGHGDQGMWVFDSNGNAVWSTPHGLFGGVKP